MEVDLNDAAAFGICFTGPSPLGSIENECEAGDLDRDGDIDCEDWTLLLLLWTAPEDSPLLGQCRGDIPAVSDWGLVVSSLVLLTSGTVVIAWRRNQPVSRA